jgi:uncharacterized PurR-regulated membrane protein YhhQ (DUF165 family)
VYQNVPGGAFSGRHDGVVGAVRAFKQDAVVAGRAGAGFRVSAHSVHEGPYRLRSANDMPWTSSYGYGRRDGFWQKLGGAVAAVTRLIIPVLVLLGCVSGVYLYRDMPVPLAGIGMPWITAADLFLPVGFFCIFMTNRRYGPAFAFAQVVVTSIVIVAVTLFGRDTVTAALPVGAVSMREAAAFGAAFFAASFVSIVVFDGARGAYWWTAPLFGFISAAIVFPFAFFPFAGTEAAWLLHAAQYAGLLAGEGVLLLIPFYLLRGIIPPMSGFGGY